MPPALWFTDQESVAAYRFGDAFPIKPVLTDHWNIFHTSLLDAENIGEIGNDRAAFFMEHYLSIQVVFIEVRLGTSRIEQGIVRGNIPK